MDSINDINPSFPREIQLAAVGDLLRFLEQMDSVLEQLNEVVSSVKGALQQNSPSFPALTLNHQVNILISLKEKSSKIQEFLEQEDPKKESLQRIRDAVTKVEVFSRENVLGESSSSRGTIPGQVSGEKSQFPSNPSGTKNVTIQSGTKTAPLSDRASSTSFTKFNAADSMTSDKEASGKRPQAVSPRTSSELLSTVLGKKPIPELLKTIRPLLEHLIVVVKTQENMAKPSEKLVHFAQAFMKDVSASLNADVLSLIKNSLPESSSTQGKLLEKGGETAALEKTSLNSATVVPPFSQEKGRISSSMTSFLAEGQNVSKPKLDPRLPNTAPFSLPYPEEKKTGKTYPKRKKKESLFRPHKDKKELEDNDDPP